MLISSTLQICYEASGELLDGVGVGISEILLEPSKVVGTLIQI